MVIFLRLFLCVFMILIEWEGLIGCCVVGILICCVFIRYCLVKFFWFFLMVEGWFLVIMCLLCMFVFGFILMI